MSDELVPDGTYNVRGPGGHLTMGDFPGVAMLPPEPGPSQQWEVACDSGLYTLRSVATQKYLGSDGDPDEPAMTVPGTSEPFTWRLSTGRDDDETTYILTSAASTYRLILTMSLLRIWPPLVAILPPDKFSVVEWALDPA